MEPVDKRNNVTRKARLADTDDDDDDEENDGDDARGKGRTGVGWKDGREELVGKKGIDLGGMKEWDTAVKTGR